MYSTYERGLDGPPACEAKPSDAKKVIILGGGPNRIGQGIEFDYCCVHGIMALRQLGIEAIMINCNPETVSTDYDVADKLYFEPLTYEDVLNVIELEKPDGVIMQFGGQTPLKLALPLEKAGVTIWGTSPDSIDLAEDRDRFGALLDSLDIAHPQYATATSVEEALEVAKKIGFPLMVRPSYVLGGRVMEIVYDMGSLENYMQRAVKASEEHPVLIDLARKGTLPIVGLNYKDKADDAQRWLKQFGNPYQLSVADADGRVGIDYGVYGVPETYLIDAAGVIRYKRIGVVTPAILEQKILPLAVALQK